MIRSFSRLQVPVPKDFLKLEAFRHSPLDIEIGCGVGYHPLQYAQENPERTLIAIEQTKEKFEKFAGRISHHKKISNLVPIHGNAVAWITHGIEIDSVNRYFLLYPNPNPKEKLRNKRWFAMPFMKHLIETLKDKGTITLATNEQFYYEEAKELGIKYWGLKIIEDRLVKKEEKPRTHFEKKYLMRGDACFNLVFQKSNEN